MYFIIRLVCPQGLEEVSFKIRDLLNLSQYMENSAVLGKLFLAKRSFSKQWNII